MSRFRATTEGNIPFTAEEELEADQQEAEWLLGQAARDEEVINDKIHQLWAAADKYTSNQISGVAIGLLTIGTLQSLPKAQAVTAWSSTLWDDYYTRKAAVTLNSTLDLDFSAHARMPYSVPELRAELGM